MAENYPNSDHIEMDLDRDDSKLYALRRKCRDLEALCRLWAAANDVKDARISDLERELAQVKAGLIRAQTNNPSKAKASSQISKQYRSRRLELVG